MRTENMLTEAIDALVVASLSEDLGVASSALRVPGGVPDILGRDVTSAAIVPLDARFTGYIVAREEGAVCGLPVVRRVWSMLSSAAGLAGAVEIEALVDEGASVAQGARIAEVTGNARVVLAGERSALNALMMLSGIATEARRWQMEAGDDLIVVDTRKTAPGLRVLSKYAVATGGASNHRYGLYDMALVKDNHLTFLGSITKTIVALRSAAFNLKLEVEADTVEQAVEAALSGADMVLLDNMDDETLAAAVAAVREVSEKTGLPVLTEASGSITFDRLARLRATGVDRVSSSALTLAAPIDFGLDELAR